MTAKLQDIKRWLEQAEFLKATHLIVAVDTHNYRNYPVYVEKGEKVQEEIERIEGQPLQGIDEVYNMSMNIGEQLEEYRAHNL